MEAVTEIEQEVPEQEQQQDPPKKLKVKDFAAKIKAKYPVYKDIDDRELTDKIIKKYPVYKDQVDFTEEVKKKDIGGTESISKVQSISPTKWEDNVLNPASQFATSPTQPKEVKPTKAKAPFSESGIFREGDAIPTISQTPDADRLESHKNPKDNRAGYLWNSLTKGIGGMLAGASDNVMNAMSSLLPDAVLGGSKEKVMKQWREQVTPITRDFVEKKIGSKTVTKEQEQKYNDEFLTSAAGGLLQSAPAMLAPKGAKLVAMVTQAQDDALQSINSTKLGKDLPESTKSVFSLGVGIAQGALEKFGFDKIFGKASGAISKKIAGKVFKELVEKSDAPITRELYEQALDTYLKTAKQQLIKGGTKIGKGGAVEFLTGSLQEGSTVFAESLLNSNTGLDVFEPKSWGDQLGRILKSGAQEAVGGLVLGGASYSMSNVDNYIADKVSQAQTPEDIDNIKREVVEQVSKDGTATPEAVEGVVKLVDDYARVKNKIPADVPNKKEVTDKILEREDIEQQIAQKKQEIQNLDPAFQKPAMIEVELLEKRVAELNDEIAKSAIGKVEEPAVSTEGKSDVVPPTEQQSGNVQNKDGETWMNRGTKINESGEFVAKDGNTYTVSHTVNSRGTVIVKVKNAEGKTVASSYFDNNGDGTYSTAKGSKISSDIEGIGLAKSIYDYTDKNVGKIRKTETTTDGGENLWRNNKPIKPQQSGKDVVVDEGVGKDLSIEEADAIIKESDRLWAEVRNKELETISERFQAGEFDNKQYIDEVNKLDKRFAEAHPEYYKYDNGVKPSDKMQNAINNFYEKGSKKLLENVGKKLEDIFGVKLPKEQSLSTKPEINNEGKQEVNAIEETPKWEEVKQKSTTEFREPEKVKEMFLQELPDTKEEIEYTDVMDGKTKLERPKYIKRELKKNHQILELLVNCLTK